MQNKTEKRIVCGSKDELVREWTWINNAAAAAAGDRPESRSAFYGNNIGLKSSRCIQSQSLCFQFFFQFGVISLFEHWVLYCFVYSLFSPCSLFGVEKNCLVSLSSVRLSVWLTAAHISFCFVYHLKWFVDWVKHTNNKNVSSVAQLRMESVVKLVTVMKKTLICKSEKLRSIQLTELYHFL